MLCSPATIDFDHRERLDQVEARLPSPPFFRIHRSYVVNLH